MVKIKRALFDTNIYGWMVKRNEAETIQNKLEAEKNIIVYGCDVIRKELRDVPKEIKVGGRSLRITLLGLYDRLAKDHSYMTTSLTRKLSADYFKVLKKISPSVSDKKIMNDLLIVACATLHDLDIVVSDDNEMMKSEVTLKTYRIVNDLREFRTPNFLTYKEFRRLLI